MQCGRAGFLRSGQNEIEPLDLSRLRSPHRHESRTANRIAQLISQKSGCADLVDLFCNAEGRFPVSSSNGRCSEGVHARNVDFFRNHNRRSLHCLACRNGRPWLPGSTQTEPCVRNPRRAIRSIARRSRTRHVRQLIEPELLGTGEHFMLPDVHCFRNFGKTKTTGCRVCNCLRRILLRRR